MQKEVKEIIKELTGKGWTHKIGRNSHQFRSPQGSLVTMAKTPSCHRAIKNVRSYINKAILADNMKIDAERSLKNNGCKTKTVW